MREYSAYDRVFDPVPECSVNTPDNPVPVGQPGNYTYEQLRRLADGVARGNRPGNPGFKPASHPVRSLNACYGAVGASAMAAEPAPTPDYPVPPSAIAA